MNKSPLKHNPNNSGLNIGNQMRRSNKQNQAQQFASQQNNEGIFNKLQTLANKTRSNENNINPAASAASNAIQSQQNIQQTQLDQATGLNTLTQGPENSSTIEVLNNPEQNYSPMIGGFNKGSSFLMKSPFNQGAYEDPEQPDAIVDTSAAEAITTVGDTTAGVVSKIGNNNNNEDKKTKDEE